MHTRDTKENTKPQTQRVTTKKHTDSKQPQRKTHWRRRCKNAFKKLQKDTTKTGTNLQETHNNLRDTEHPQETQNDTARTQNNLRVTGTNTRKTQNNLGANQDNSKKRQNVQKANIRPPEKHLCRHTRGSHSHLPHKRNGFSFLATPMKVLPGHQTLYRVNPDSMTRETSDLWACVEKRWTQNNSQENHRVARGAANVSGCDYTSWCDRSQCAFI